MDENNSYLFNTALHGGVTNAIVNGLFGWFLSGGKTHLPIYGGEGVLVDYLATTAILIIILTLIVLPMQPKKAPLNMNIVKPAPAYYQTFFAYMSVYRNIAIAGLLALYGVILVAPSLLLVFEVFSISELSRLHYSVAKGLLMGVVAALVVYPIVYMVIKPVGKQATVIGDKP
jgi:hypothetical protein